MKINLGNLIGFSFMFGAIGALFCSFYMDTILALSSGAFVFAVNFIVFFIYMKLYSRGDKTIRNPDSKTIFKEVANYYTDKLVGNGVLLLSNKALYFFQHKNGIISKTEIQLQQIEEASYGKIFRHIKGVRIRLKEGSILGFTTRRYQFLLDQLYLIRMNDDTLTSDLGVARSNLVNSDGWAHHSNADVLVKIRPDGNNKTLTLDAPLLMFCLYDDHIYYVPYGELKSNYIPDEEEVVTVYSIYSCRTDGSDNKLISEMPRALPSGGKMQMRVVDGWIYLGLSRGSKKSSYDLYRMSIDGTGMTMISTTDDMIFDFIIDNDGWIWLFPAH